MSTFLIIMTIAIWCRVAYLTADVQQIILHSYLKRKQIVVVVVTEAVVLVSMPDVIIYKTHLL